MEDNETAKKIKRACKLNEEGYRNFLSCEVIDDEQVFLSNIFTEKWKTYWRNLISKYGIVVVSLAHNAGYAASSSDYARAHMEIKTSFYERGFWSAVRALTEE